MLSLLQTGHLELVLQISSELMKTLGRSLGQPGCWVMTPQDKNTDDPVAVVQTHRASNCFSNKFQEDVAQSRFDNSCHGDCVFPEIPWALQFISKGSMLPFFISFLRYFCLGELERRERRKY